MADTSRDAAPPQTGARPAVDAACPAVDAACPSPPAALPLRRRLEQRGVVLGAALLLFLATVVVRQQFAGNRDELLGLMFVIPIALVGLELGVWGGLAVGLASLLLVALQGSHSEPALDAAGVAMRAVVYLGVGALAGRFSDRMRAFQLHQARLLATEHERAALAAELYLLQQRLQEQFRNAGRVLDQQEQERREIAEQLHEQAAQAMAAALLAVDRLQRDTTDELAEAHLQRARQSVRECIAELRRLAGSLRSPVLEQLGLLPALEQLCETDRHERGRSVSLCTDGIPAAMTAEVERSAYRAVEEALAALAGADEVAIRVGGDGDGTLQIAIDAGGLPAAAHEPAARGRVDAGLRTARARLAMLGGSLRAGFREDGAALTVQLPLTPPLAREDGAAAAP
jgi:signal transduction histidine kinase